LPQKYDRRRRSTCTCTSSPTRGEHFNARGFGTALTPGSTGRGSSLPQTGRRDDDHTPTGPCARRNVHRAMVRTATLFCNRVMGKTLPMNALMVRLVGRIAARSQARGSTQCGSPTTGRVVRLRQNPQYHLDRSFDQRETPEPVARALGGERVKRKLEAQARPNGRVVRAKPGAARRELRRSFGGRRG